jgi:putative glycosyltransferase (TIGR04372 family)
MINKIINKFFYLIKYYTIIEPHCYIGSYNYKNLLRNLLYFSFIQSSIKKFIKTLRSTIIKVFLDIWSIIFLPIIIMVYFTKYRFIQLEYSQIGIFAHQLNGMCKFYFLENKTPIICVPRTVSRSHIKKIFNKLIIVDSLFLNVLFLPLINSSLISCRPDYVESFYKNKKLERTATPLFCKIIQDYTLTEKQNYFQLSKSYEKKMNILFNKKFKDYDLNNTFVLHVRDVGFVKSSDLRNANLKNYTPSIDMMLNKNYNVIRIVHSKSEKLNFTKNYAEMNIEEKDNEYLQYYLLSKCRGFICGHSGPGPLGALLNTPILELNLFPLEISYALKKNDIFVPKKLLFNNERFLPYNEIFGSDVRFVNSTTQMNIRKLNAVENSEDEVFEAVSEFIDIQNNKSQSFTINQLNFKKSIPSVSSLNYIDGRISDYFIKKNYHLFF